MASKEMRAAAEEIRAAGTFSGTTIDVAEMRKNMEMMATASPLPEDVSRTDFDAGGIPCCHIGVPEARNDRGVLYLHGGGYVLGSLDTHAELMGRIARACRAPVLGVGYRLAPEVPYPGALEDAVASYDGLIAQGIPADKIVIAGDSAGGGLALACLLRLKEQAKPQPAGVVLLSPWTDLTGSGASVETRTVEDVMVSPALLTPMAALYAGTTDPAEPELSPLFGDLSDLAPMLIQVGDHEILLDDSTRLVEKAEAAGVSVEVEVFDGGFHVFQNVPGLPESAAALKSIGAFFDRVTS
jgi:acetyl esterase/lipase